MVQYTILAGGYHPVIARYVFDSDTSTLSLKKTFPTGKSPTWIALHPTKKYILYATNETNRGALQSFSINAQGDLSSPVDTVSSAGSMPAFAGPLSNGQVAVMNYSSGNGVVIPTTTSPLHFDHSASPIIFPVPTGLTSHPHAAYEFGNELLVPDLGADKVWRLAEDGAPGKWKIQGEIEQPQGSGPRHAVVQGNTLFTLHELDNSLTAQNIGPPPNGFSVTLATTNVAPTDNGVPAGAKFAAAEILMPPTSNQFPTPFIYISNRNVGTPDPRGDSIAIFQFLSEPRQRPEFKLIAQVFTGLRQIRGMAFSEDGQFLAAGASHRGGIKVFQRVDGGRGLKEIAKNTELEERTTFVWPMA